MQSSHTTRLQLPSFRSKRVQPPSFLISPPVHSSPSANSATTAAPPRFFDTQVVIKCNGHTVLTDHHSLTTRLWYLDVISPTASPHQAIAASPHHLLPTHSNPSLSKAWIRESLICDGFPFLCKLHCFLRVWVLTQVAILEFFPGGVEAVPFEI
jgi:hypothetical protein